MNVAWGRRGVDRMDHVPDDEDDEVRREVEAGLPCSELSDNELILSKIDEIFLGGEVFEFPCI
jgi:hypothetical protein